MRRRTAVVAVVMVVGAAAVLVLRARESDSDGGSGVLHGASVEPAQIDFQTVTLRGGLEHEPVAVGDALVSYAEPPEPRLATDDRASEVVYSTDLGATWERAELPGLPPVEGEITRSGEILLHRLDDAVAVEIAFTSRTTDEPALYLWVSEDGLEWRGGVLNMLDLDNSWPMLADIWRDEDGRLYATVLDNTEVPRFVIRSEDDGATWEETECSWPAPTRADGCDPVERAGRLWVRPDNSAISLDSGKTWVEPELLGIDIDENGDFDAVERPDGGWLAVATEVEHADSEYERTTTHHLLRSDDGMHWERVFHHDSRCSDRLPYEEISTPVPFGRRWVVAYTCHNPAEATSRRPLLSQLLVLNADGSSITPIADTVESHYRYGQPGILGGDTVVVPLQNPDATRQTNLRQLPAA